MIENIPINYVVGQKWIEIQGVYTADQLRLIAKRIDEHYERAFKKKEEVKEQ